MTLEHLFMLLPVGSTVEVSKMVGNLRYDVQIYEIARPCRHHYGRAALLGTAIDRAYKSFLDESPSHTSIKKV